MICVAAVPVVHDSDFWLIIIYEYNSSVELAGSALRQRVYSPAFETELDAFNEHGPAR